MSINYVGYHRRRLKSAAQSLKNHATEVDRDKRVAAEDAAWLHSVADRIAALAADIEAEEPRYRKIDRTAPDH